MPDFLNIKARLAVLLAIAGGVVLVSGGTTVDPPVPRGFPGVVPAVLVKAGAGWERRDEERAAIRRDRHWLARSKQLGDAAPGWARSKYRRSLLVLRACVDRHSGAAVAGARPGWAYVWPRDAGAVAIALAEAGYREEARRIARFLLGLDLDAAARFDQRGRPVGGRAAQGDAAGWVVAAGRAAGLQVGAAERARLAAFGLSRDAWRGRADYQEKGGGDYLGNALASSRDGPKTGDMGPFSARRLNDWIVDAFATRRGLVRSAGDPDSGLDSTAAWAVRPFRQPALFPAARGTLLRLVAQRESRFGLLPSEDWDGGEDPWTAPTAWTAWALAALANECGADECRPTARRDRRAALNLMADLRRAATPLGLLPERVDAQTGLPTSTTPLAWSHAFAILAIRELWPSV